MEIAEHIARDPVLVSRMANAQPHTSEFSADMIDGGSYAIMASGTAAGLYLYLERGEIEFVVKDGDVLWLQLIKIHGGTDAAAAFVHERGGFQQYDLFGAKPELLHPALKFLGGQWQVVDFGQGINRHEADIMPVHGIGRSGITKAYP